MVKAKLSQAEFDKIVALQHKAVLKPAVFESLMNWGVEP